MRLALALVASAVLISAQEPKYEWNAAEQPIAAQIKTLRSVPDDERPAVTKDLALRIRKLRTPGKQSLAIQLANLATEGDAGHDTLQETATTLALAMAEKPSAVEDPYTTLAQYVRYEHIDPAGWAMLGDTRYRAAMAKLEADDAKRQKLDFTLTDLHGKSWTLQKLSGKVVLVNFWATWCPPCRKEMPDLDSIYREFQGKGLVILSISDEERVKVDAYLGEHPVSYSILLDPGDRVEKDFIVQGIPKTFVYDRQGHLAAQSIDMRTRRQFVEMLKRAGL
jgi:thiol-disulfide isomerase/thioredoxin